MSESGLQLTSFQDALQFAEQLVISGAAPKGMRPGAVVGAIQAGAEIGAKPMQSLNLMSAINGRFWPMTKLAKAKIKEADVLREGTKIEEWIEVDGEVVKTLPDDFKTRETIAYCKSWRKDEEEPNVTLFSWSDAKRANLDDKDGPWKEYPQRQLMHRARGFHFDDHFGDVLLGFTIAEVAGDYPEEPRERDVTPEKPAIPASTEVGDVVEGERDTKGAAAAAKAVLGELSDAKPLPEPEVIEPEEDVEGGEQDSAQAPEPEPDVPTEEATSTEKAPESAPPEEKKVEKGSDKFIPPDCHHCGNPIDGEIARWRNNTYHPEHTPTALKKAKEEEAAARAKAAEEAEDAQDPEGEWDADDSDPAISAEQLDNLRRTIGRRADAFVDSIPAGDSIEAQIVSVANKKLAKEGKFAIAAIEELPARYFDKVIVWVPNAKYVKLEDIK